MSEFVYVLKTVNSAMKARNDFVYPTSGMVECLDWDPTPNCGKGLHGFLNGCGDGSLASWEGTAKWLVLKVIKTDIINLKNKVKFPRAEVVFVGSRLEAIAKLEELNPETKNMPVIGAEREGGDYSVAITGYSGTSTSGYSGTSVSGNYGTSISGKYGKSVSGDFGESVSGNYGESISGYRGTSVSGQNGVVQSGSYGTLEIRFNDKDGQEKSVVGKVGYNGLKPYTIYKLSEDQTGFVKA